MLQRGGIKPSISRILQRPALSRPITAYAALPVKGDVSVMVFGAGTDVGKTIICAGLSMAALQANRRVCYIKPVQTGSLDEYFIQLYCNPRGINDIFVRTLHHWKVNKAPHLLNHQQSSNNNRKKVAAPLPVSDLDLLSGIQREMKVFSEIELDIPDKKRKSPFIVVETAGGVLSPGPNQTLQADVYRSLRLPVVLVADGRVGGISATLTSFESLRLRGYTVHAIVLIAQDANDSLGNSATIQAHLDAVYKPIPGDTPVNPHHSSSDNTKWSLQRSPKVFTLTPITNDKNQLLHNWFQQNMSTFLDVFHHVNHSEAMELDSFVEMHKAGLKNIWWPATNYNKVRPEDVGFIESAHGDHYRVVTYPNHSQKQSSDTETHPANPSANDTTNTHSSSHPNHKPHHTKNHSNHNHNLQKAEFVSAFDGSASWWTQAVGHGHVDVAAAIGEAAGRYGHVLFPRHLHAPAVQLARYLTEKGPGDGWASRVFFSENESSAIRVGLQMAFRLANHRRQQRQQQTQSETQTLTNDTTNKKVVLIQQGAQHALFDAAEEVVSIATPGVAYKRGQLHLMVDDLQDTAIQRLVNESHSDSQEEEGHTAAFSPSDSVFATLTELFDVSQRLQTPLAGEYRRYIRSFLQNMSPDVTVLVIEPLLIAHVGMKFVDPLFQHLLIQEARHAPHPLVIVADETVSGLYRLGPVAATQWLQETPDIACFAKMLTGGYVPLAATLARDEVFQAFFSASAQEYSYLSTMLMHNHSFTASPIACAAALETIRLLENAPRLETHDVSHEEEESGDDTAAEVGDTDHHSRTVKRAMRHAFSEEDLRLVSKMPGVHSAMSLGSILSIRLTQQQSRHSGGRDTAEVSSGVSSGWMDECVSSSSSLALAVIRLLRHVGQDTVCLVVTPYTTDYGQQRILRVLRRVLTKAFYAARLERDTAVADTQDTQDTEHSTELKRILYL